MRSLPRVADPEVGERPGQKPISSSRLSTSIQGSTFAAASGFSHDGNRSDELQAASTREEGSALTIAYILRSYPRLSQTFIINEILELEQLGLKILVFAISQADDKVVQENVAHVKAPAEYLDSARGTTTRLRENIELATRSPLRYLRTCAYLFRRRDLDVGYVSCSRWACFLHAVHLADVLRRLDDDITHVHAHFAHDPALVALLLKRLTGIKYSFTAHARDLYQTQRLLLRERIGDAEAVVTCCRANLAYLNRLSPDSKRQVVTMVHHGVDTQAFRPPRRQRPLQHVPVIIAAGRLVEKKGFHDLLEACSLLRKDDCSFHCVIHGDGPLFEDLLGAICDHGLTSHVSLAGVTTQLGLAAAFQRADIFALTSHVTDDGDRDGIPNVLLEAMACRLPPVATLVGGIGEVVIHDHNGLLAPARDVSTIAVHLAGLLTDEDRRLSLGRRARETVVDQFDPVKGARALMDIFTASVGKP